MDCEMVGVGPDGIRSNLARVSIVNFEGQVWVCAWVRAFVLARLAYVSIDL